MRFTLKTLTLNGREIHFSGAWLDWERPGPTTLWTGFVQGADGTALMEIPELELAAETIDGRQLVGRVLVPAASLNGDAFRLQGTDVLLAEGRDLGG